MLISKEEGEKENSPELNRRGAILMQTPQYVTYEQFLVAWPLQTCFRDAGVYFEVGDGDEWRDCMEICSIGAGTRSVLGEASQLQRAYFSFSLQFR